MASPKGASDLCARGAAGWGTPMWMGDSLLCPLSFVGSVGPEEGLGLEPSLQYLGSGPQ
ncbi:hypothetical protein ACRRTK_008548 [Alexandromys fortis]